MSMKPILFSVTLFLGIGADAAPKAPKAQLKKAAELKECQSQLNALSETSSNAERSAAAQCQFWIAEQSYAKFTALKPPKAFDKDKLATWLESSKKQREDTSALYLKVKDLGDKEQSVAAMARIGLMSYQFATGIQNAPMPTIIEYDMDGDGTLEQIKIKGEIKAQVEDAVKTQMKTIYAPILGDAKAAFEVCVQEAKDNKIENKWSQLCADYILLVTPTIKEPTQEKATPTEAPAEAKTPEATIK